MKNELCHHGIDGQRWGVTHGPPYPLSRAEHRAVVNSQKATMKRKLSYGKSGKYAKRMSDDDLNATIDRLKREETYRQLVSKEKEEKRTKREIKRVNREAKKETKEARKDQAKNDSKNQNKQDGVIKKSIKESIGGGIKTLSAAGAKQLADAIWPGEKKKADVQYTRDKDGKWSAVIKGTPDSSSAVAKDVEKNLAIFNKPLPKKPESKWSIKDIDMDAIPWSWDAGDFVGTLEKDSWDKVTSINVDDLGDFYKF